MKNPIKLVHCTVITNQVCRSDFLQEEDDKGNLTLNSSEWDLILNYKIKSLPLGETLLRRLMCHANIVICNVNFRPVLLSRLPSIKVFY